jgi:oligosaccharide repeat unit polymerase
MKIIVLLQIFLIWFIVLWIYNKVARRDCRPPIDDFGIWWLSVFLLYTTLAPLAWLVQGGSYGPLSGRLYNLQPTTQEVIYLLNIALAYIFGFTSVYLVFLVRVRPPNIAAQARIGDSKMAGAAVIVLVASLIGVILSISGNIRPAGSYSESYMIAYELPRGLRQLIKIVGGFSGAATLVLMVAIFQRWPKYRFIFLCYLLSIILAINPEGGRGKVVTPLLSMIVAWHVLIRPIPAKKVFIGAFFGLLCFIVLGILRNINSVSEVGVIGFEGIGLGEFDALWANAIELLQAKKIGQININFGTRFGEILNFVPSQLLWFEKLSLNDWYLNTFYPGLKEETGTGWVFGAISQAVIGGGLFEAAIRGVIIGALAGWLMKWVRTPSKAWWRFPLHLFILTGVFAGIRETTFIQFDGLVQVWLIAPILITFIGDSFTKKRDFKNDISKPDPLLPSKKELI